MCTVVILTGPNGMNPIGESDKIITSALNIPIFVIVFVEMFFINPPLFLCKIY
ncbi:hypothetical protein HMPREF3181_00664 [Parvimonas sp. KA00067]|nr:hypothetical protein HMPREF3181_00664 [Parvimonas sp. KA00067]